ncbi:unnamed protein product [Calypogeia fissa]
MYMIDLAGQGQWKECRSLPPPPFDKFTTQIEYLIFSGDDYRFAKAGCKGWFGSFWRMRNTTNDRWEEVEPGPMALAVDKIPYTCFQIGRKPYVLKGRWTRVDVVTRTVAHEDSIASKIPPAVGEIGYSIKVEPLFILPVNNELLAIALWKNWEDGPGHGHRGVCLIESIGFGSESSRYFAWQKVHYSADYSLHEDSTFAMCPIEL